MGYSLRSFTDLVVACAPLFSTVLTVNSYPTGDRSGRCVILQGNLSNVLQLPPENEYHFGGADIGIITSESTEHLVLSSLLNRESECKTAVCITMDAWISTL